MSSLASINRHLSNLHPSTEKIYKSASQEKRNPDKLYIKLSIEELTYIEIAQRIKWWQLVNQPTKDYVHYQKKRNLRRINYDLLQARRKEKTAKHLGWISYELGSNPNWKLTICKLLNPLIQTTHYLEMVIPGANIPDKHKLTHIATGKLLTCT